MSKLSERIKSLRNSAELTQQELANILRISKSSVNMYERGEREPGIATLEAIADYFNVDMNYLTGLSDVKVAHPLPSSVSGAVPYHPTHRIPILGRISAGLPLYADEHIEGYTYTDLNGGAEYFALRVSGDSMNAIRIYDGDLLIVRRQDIVDNGDVAVVLVGDEDATVKRFYKEGNTVTLMPQSTNPEHQPQIYDARKTRIRIQGRVVRNEIAY